MNEFLCREWEASHTCSDKTCSARHSLYHLDRNRSEIDCFWETNGGCKKAHCPFKHHISRGSASKNESNIVYMEGSGKLVEGHQTTQLPSSSIPAEMSKMTQNTFNYSSSVKETDSYKRTNLDEKFKEKVSVKKVKNDDVVSTFEVKTFEQIMKEKKLKQASQEKIKDGKIKSDGVIPKVDSEYRIESFSLSDEKQSDENFPKGRANDSNEKSKVNDTDCRDRKSSFVNSLTNVENEVEKLACENTEKTPEFSYEDSILNEIDKELEELNQLLYQK